MADAGGSLRPMPDPYRPAAVDRWLALICRCPHKTSRHGCHHVAELAVNELGEPTQRDRQLLRIVR